MHRIDPDLLKNPSIGGKILPFVKTCLANRLILLAHGGCFHPKNSMTVA